MIKQLTRQYRAGAREFAWIKKREYQSDLADALELVIGALYGRGCRVGTPFFQQLMILKQTRLEVPVKQASQQLHTYGLFDDNNIDNSVMLEVCCDKKEHTFLLSFFQFKVHFKHRKYIF